LLGFQVKECNDSFMLLSNCFGGLAGMVNDEAKIQLDNRYERV